MPGARRGLRVKRRGAVRRTVGTIRDRRAARPTAADVVRPMCHDLASWAASWPDAERWSLAPASSTSRPRPKTIEPVIDPTFEPLCNVAVPERALVKIPGGRLRGQAGLVVLPTDELVGELVALTREGRHAILRTEPAYREPLPSRATRRDGNYVAVLGLGVHHYYHWSHDLIMGMRGIAPWLPADTELIVPERMSPFQVETLALLGLDQHRRVAFPRDQFWELENLYVVTPRLKTQIDSAEPFRWFRDAAMRRYGIADAAPTRRYYVTRRDDKHWRTTNETAVVDLLATYGFETVAPATLRFREQIEVFRHAEMIVGTGAGLFNMVFSPPGARVLQFQESSHIVHALWTCAAAMEFDYHYMLCESVPNPGGTNADLHVPLGKLRDAVDAMAA